MTVTCRLIARLLFVVLLWVAAPFSIADEGVIAHEQVTGALAETGPFDTRADLDDSHGPSQESNADSTLQLPETDAQEHALLMEGAWSDALALSAAVALAELPVQSPALAALDRPPRLR